MPEKNEKKKKKEISTRQQCFHQRIKSKKKKSVCSKSRVKLYVECKLKKIIAVVDMYVVVA